MPPLFQAAMSICRRTQNGNRFLQVSLKARRTAPGNIQNLLENEERPDPEPGLFVDFSGISLDPDVSPTGFGSGATLDVRITRVGAEQYHIRYEIQGGSGYAGAFLEITDLIDLGSGSCPPTDPAGLFA
jgi:hypothetical protein